MKQAALTYRLCELVEKSPLNYQECAPNAELSKYVKCFCTLESEGKPYEPSRERIFPDGSMELVFHYGDCFEHVQQNGQHELQPRKFVYVAVLLKSNRREASVVECSSIKRRNNENN